MRRILIVPVLAASALAACGAGGAGSSTPSASTPAAPPATADAAPATTSAARPAATGVRLQRVGGQFDQPVYVAAPPGDRRRVFVVEQPGRIRVLTDGRDAGTFVDIRSEVGCCGEQGLLSMAFAPDYARSGKFYVDYTDKGGTSRVVEYRRSSNPARASRASRRLVLTQSQPEPNHNGGQLQFGPDGLLYIGFGDGGGAGDQHGPRGNGQSLDTQLGKILRIDPPGRPYRIPAGNPFVGRAGRDEIYAYGLRNPWRFSFDRKTGDLTIGDVGQDQVEEIDFMSKGAARGVNFGWRVFEGNRRYTSGESAPAAVGPVHTYSHDDGCSITGGYVVRDPGLPGLAGRYVYADYCAGKIRSIRLAKGRGTGDRGTGLSVAQPTSFGEDGRGRVYVTSQSGQVYRLAPR
jgi:glucose/arabinose dehydrogenase